MARRGQKDAERTRTRIVASALALFARKGYEHTTFTDIAARLKMTKGAVYWHFASKEALLMALVDEMLEKFARQISELMPKDELTFPAVADMMVRNAERIVEDPKGTAFFMLMKTQVRWRDDSMAKVREDLLTNKRFGPFHAFLTAVGNDIRAGRVRRDVDAEEVAVACLAEWESLVQWRIDGFLKCDLGTTLRHSYAAVWRQIKLTGSKGSKGQGQRV